MITPVRDESARHQRLVNEYFQSAAPFWEAIYKGKDINAAIHQERGRRVLSLVAGLGIPKNAQVLEIGCGAGLTAVALAETYLVDAVDIVQEMLDRTRERAILAGVAHRLNTSLRDATNLAYPDASFDLVLAIGVLPWVRDNARVLRESTRVLRPGGHLIVNIDNKWALHRFLDPQLNPVIQPVKKLIKALLHRVRVLTPEAQEQVCTLANLDKSLRQNALVKLSGGTLGFGPFSLFCRPVLPCSLAWALNCRLQKLTDRENVLARSIGSQYIVVAQKRF